MVLDTVGVPPPAHPAPALRACFDAFDPARSGALAPPAATAALRACGLHGAAAYLPGAADSYTFTDCLGSVQALRAQQRQQALSAFRALDPGGTGHVSAAQLLHILSSVPAAASAGAEQTVRALLQRAGQLGEGDSIDYRAFVEQSAAAQPWAGA